MGDKSSTNVEASFGKKTTAEEVVKALQLNLTGQNVIVTGANTGLGKETSRALALAHANVYLFYIL